MKTVRMNKMSPLLLGVCLGLPLALQAAPPPAEDAPATKAKVLDRLDLDVSKITGTRELPKVLAIVPWKPDDLGAMAGGTFASLVDEALRPVDRPTAHQEVIYFQALQAEPAANAGAPITSDRAGQAQ
jgi:hypothetical protein